MGAPLPLIALGLVLVVAGLAASSTWVLLAGLLVTVTGGVWAAVRQRGQDRDGLRAGG